MSGGLKRCLRRFNGLLIIACTGGQPATLPTPTPDVDATVAAGTLATPATISSSKTPATGRDSPLPVPC